MAQPLNFDLPRKLEKQAGEILDPVERLRFLRGQVQAAKEAAPKKARTRHVSLVLAGLILLITFVPLPMGTAETLAKERKLVVSGPKLHTAIPRVWLVDKNDSLELYSNGLRIDLTFAVANYPRRRFPVYSPSGGKEPLEMGSMPVGIVFHTTESNLVPFEEGENHRLQRLGKNLMEWVRQDHSYHYVIDRFGRVYRIVKESDAANHSGTSIWADSQGVYVNLNDSFIGVSFEGQTGAIDEVTPAQIAAGKVLTEMLRSRYGIRTEDCVTHAQVSINPKNMLIGEHTDWAGRFPFDGVGLPDNYALPIASMYVYGFDYDKTFLRVTGRRWPGLDLAEQQVSRQAAAEGVDLKRYRAFLQHRYKDISVALR